MCVCVCVSTCVCAYVNVRTCVYTCVLGLGMSVVTIFLQAQIFIILADHELFVTNYN